MRPKPAVVCALEYAALGLRVALSTPLFKGASSVEAVRAAARKKVRAKNQYVDDAEIDDAVDAGMDRLFRYWLPKYERRYAGEPKKGFNLAVHSVEQRARDWLRREYKRRRRLEKAAADATERRQLHWAVAGEAPKPQTPPECLHMAVVREEVARLPDRQRAVVEALYWYNWSLAAIADELGVSDTTVSRDRRRALEHLKGRVPAPEGQCPVCRCWGGW